MIETYKNSKGLSIMVWVCFSGRLGRSDLYIIERDPESKRGGYSANSYITLLEEMIPTVWEPELLYMQDNTSIHTAKKVTK
jgi:hypothetical protein